MNMHEAIASVVAGNDLSSNDMSDVMQLIMTGEATPAQIGGFLIGLRIKGETVAEIAAAAGVMRSLSAHVDVDTAGLVDTCGTGGSGANKFNVSTAAAFVAAASGVRVAKHGNRAASSKSGSADLLEAAGANIMMTPAEVARCIDTIGVGFLFAQSHHAAMKHAIGPRREVGTRTLFNLLGPLTNPAGAKRQVMGVFAPEWVAPLAEVLSELGSEHVMVLHSEDGLDEISVAAPTHVAELKDGEITTYHIEPATFGLERHDLEPLRVNDSAESLALVNAALDASNEAASDMVALNAGAAIYVAGGAVDLKGGVAMAQDAIAAGLAAEKMKDFANFTQQLGDH